MNAAGYIILQPVLTGLRLKYMDKTLGVIPWQAWDDVSLRLDAAHKAIDYEMVKDTREVALLLMPLPPFAVPEER
jgi:hypothetical protein